MQIEQLERLELGILFGALLDSRDAEQRLARISDPAGERCLQAYRTIQHLDPAARRRLVLSLSRRLFSPLPSNINRVHPSWINHLLVKESDAVIAAVLPFLPEGIVRRLDLLRQPAHVEDLAPQLRQQLCRDVLSPLVDMPPAPPARTAEDPRDPDDLNDLVSWSEHRILDCLTHLGYLALARFARLTEPSLQQALLERVPPPQRVKLRQAMEASLPALSCELSDQPPDDLDVELQQQVMHLGVRAIAPGLPLPVRRQLAQRIPRPIGQMLLSIEGDLKQPPVTLRAVIRADRWARGGSLP